MNPPARDSTARAAVRHRKALLEGLAVTAVYLCGAVLGKQTALLPLGIVTPIWPPSGIALAALLLRGPHLWWAIWLGEAISGNLSFFDGSTASSLARSVVVGMSMGMGAALQALAGASLVNRFAGGARPFEKAGTAMRFLVLGGLLTCLVSASVGTSSLALGGIVPAGQAAATWLTWWIGDTVGVLVVGSLLLVWSEWPRARSWRAAASASFPVVSVAIGSVLVFGSPWTKRVPESSFAFLILPLVMWATIRLGQHGATLSLLVVVAIADVATAKGVGPFAGPSVSRSLAVLQVFVGAVTAAALGLSGVLAERRDAEKAVREAARRKDEFIAVLSHELRNPLAPIRNSVFILERAPGTANADRSVQMIKRQVTHLTRLIDDLLEVTRITRGKVQLRLERLSLTDTVARAVEDFRPTSTDANLQLEVELAPEPLWLRGDATRLAQVLGNLLNNAAKFTQAGGRVRVSSRREERMAVLSVSDTGIGILPEMLSHIFEPFAQAAQPLDRPRGGLGLGLALVKGIVELHGGTVAATSAGPGQGSEFVVRLPLEQTEHRDVPAAPALG